MPDMAMAPADLSIAPDLSFPDRDPSNHPTLPQVDNFQGPVLSAPEVYTVVWPGDEDLGAQVDKFTGWMVKSDYFTKSLGEYGVGAGVAKGVIVLPSAAPKTIDDSAIKSTVRSVVAMIPGGVNNNTVISFLIPKTSTSTMQGGSGCNDYEGYHAQTRAVAGGSQSVSYAVYVQCDDPMIPAFDMLTDVISHEIAEAATDPLPFTAPGWTNTTVLLGGEIGDLCVGLDTKIDATFDEGDAGSSHETYLVQRLYSQKIAQSGDSDPCIPAPAVPYFNVGLEPSDSTITLDPTTGEGEATIKLEPFAFGNVGDIKFGIYTEGSGLGVDPQTGTAKAGETLRLTIKATTKQKGNQFPLIVEAQLADGTVNEWWGSITVK